MKLLYVKRNMVCCNLCLWNNHLQLCLYNFYNCCHFKIKIYFVISEKWCFHVLTLTSTYFAPTSSSYCFLPLIMQLKSYKLIFLSNFAPLPPPSTYKTLSFTYGSYPNSRRIVQTLIYQHQTLFCQPRKNLEFEYKDLMEQVKALSWILD